ncbi:MAG TPA: VWA domain-containing protein [Alphaproteobacteria bacterium]|nr:VWA domain-containing protein [Alphaproteobacteria bacterium]
MTSAIPANVLSFARVLRQCGLSIGTGQALAAAAALERLGPQSRTDWKVALRGNLITFHRDFALFDLAFEQFWAAGDPLAQQLAMLLPQTILAPKPQSQIGARRLSDALHQTKASEQAQWDLDAQARGTATDIERLNAKDFAQMTADEAAAAERALTQMGWALPTKRSRRRKPSHHGRIDPRATLRAALRTQGDAIALRRHAPQRTERPLVALLDISGSMSAYSRIVLHFLHALMRRQEGAGHRLHVFLFGTRLTNITRALRHRDVDDAMAGAAALTPDWDGGTRIAPALEQFHRLWTRRTLGQGAHILLITDGLERDDAHALSAAAARLRAFAHGITWANPLLGYKDFAPRAAGIRALLPHVDRHVPVHNLNSVADLAQALGSHHDRRKL